MFVSFSDVLATVNGASVQFPNHVRGKVIKGQCLYLLDLGPEKFAVIHTNYERRSSGVHKFLGNASVTFFQPFETKQNGYFITYTATVDGMTSFKKLVLDVTGEKYKLPEAFSIVIDAPERPRPPQNGTWVRNYSYKPDTLFNGYLTSPVPYAVGVENEVLKVIGDNDRRTIDKHAEDVHHIGYGRIKHPTLNALVADELLYVKSDGSVGEAGFEMVSHPFTVDGWYASGCARYAMIRDYLITEGFAPHNFRNPGQSLGLHLHVSRPADMKNNSEKMKALIAYYDKFFDKFFAPVNRRGSVSYAKKNNGNINGIGDHGNRQYQINGEHERTIEFRGGRSTLSIATLSGAIELYSSLVKTFDEFDKLPTDYMTKSPLELFGDKLTAHSVKHLSTLAAKPVPSFGDRY